MSDIRTDRAWLLRSRVKPVGVEGALELDGDRLSFTLDRLAAEAALDWLEQQLGVDGLGARLEAGEKVVAFDHALADCEVSWPLTGGGAQMVVMAPDGRWIVSYEDPSRGKLAHTLGLLSGRWKARDWKRAFAQAGA